MKGTLTAIWPREALQVATMRERTRKVEFEFEDRREVEGKRGKSGGGGRGLGGVP